MMGRIVSIEGCIGAGKTSLVNFLSEELGTEKIVEHTYQNPFIDEFYQGGNVKLETELTFLLQHYSLLKTAGETAGLVLADFSIEKDLVFARLNLTQNELRIFRNLYDFVIDSVGTQELTIFLDVPILGLIERIRLRGRPHEVNADPAYFRNYSEQLKSYFMNDSKAEVFIVDAKDLELNLTNVRLIQIRGILQQII